MSTDPDPTRDMRYLDHVTAAYLAAPEGSGEEEALRVAYASACARLDVEPAKRMEVATSRPSPSKPSEELPRIVRLIEALCGALEPRVEGWLLEKPWGDIDVTPEEFIARVVVRAVGEVEEMLGAVGLVPEHDEDMLVRHLIVEVIVLGQTSARAVNEDALGERVRVALAVLRGVASTRVDADEPSAG